MALVFVVDDDADSRDTLADVLGEEGYQVQTCGDATEALQRLEQGLRPDVILLDLVMPGMSGDEMLQRLRATADLAKVPVVVLSARIDWQPPAGVESLRKPVELATVLDAVRVHTSAQHP
ncbi:MAG TPA: response regulator [Polyangiaceae bacterium]